MNKLTVVKLEHLLDATPLDVASSYYVWLLPNRMAREYVKYLTRPFISKLITTDYKGPLALYECRSSTRVSDVVAELEKSDAFIASKRSNGGNGIWQASFAKYRQFWEFIEDGGSLPGGDVFHISTRIQRLFKDDAGGDDIKKPKESIHLKSVEKAQLKVIELEKEKRVSHLTPEERCLVRIFGEPILSTKVDGQVTEIAPEIQSMTVEEKSGLPISELKLSARAFSALNRVEITKVGELIGKTESELMELKIGRKTSEEIVRKLNQIGLS